MQFDSLYHGCMQGLRNTEVLKLTLQGKKCSQIYVICFLMTFGRQKLDNNIFKAKIIYHKLSVKQ